MDVRLLHLCLVSIWAGVLLCELVVELSARDDEGRRRAAHAHFWIDVCVEAPVLFGVLGSGTWLLGDVVSWTSLHTIKIACALAAIGINLSCVWLVVRRYGHRDDPALLARDHARVRFAALGFPPGIVAAYIGLHYFA